MTTQYQVAGSLISSREAAIRAAIESWAGDTSASEWTEDQIREYLPGWCKAPEGVDQAELDAEVVQTAIAMMHAAATGGIGAEEKTMSHTIPTNLIETLSRGVTLERCTITTLAELAAEHDVVVRVTGRSIPDSSTVVVLPGYYATDGNAEVEYRAAKSAKEAAREYVESGDWGERDKTIWIDVTAYRRGFVVVGEDDEVVEIRIDEKRHTITLDPEEPDCTDGQTHDWRERDVRGHGGGLIITDVCAHCGRYRIHDTWAQRPDTGEQGLGSVEYRDPDDASRAWVESLRGEGDDE